MNWKELQNGYGLEKLPPEIRREVACCWCGDTKVLYTDQRIAYSNLKELRAVISNIRQRCWCKEHAIEFFSEESL